jgi:hypothetical protein
MRQLLIEDRETEQLSKELARRLGLTIEKAIKIAVVSA